MNVRTLVRTVPAEPPFPPLVETREVTWAGREVEVHQQRGREVKTRSYVFETPHEVAEFVAEALEEWTEEGFAEGTPPRTRRARDPRRRDVVLHARAWPRDRAIRQVLADWLVERGEAFGEQAGCWLQSPEGPTKRRLALDVHEAVFAGWIVEEIGAVWDDAFLTSLDVAVAVGRQDTLARKLPRVLAHPAAWLLQSLELCSVGTWSPEPGFERAENEDLYSIVDAVIATGPHPTVRRLGIVGDPDERFDLPALAMALPGVTELAWGGPLEAIWPLPAPWSDQLETLRVARVGAVSTGGLRAALELQEAPATPGELERRLRIDGEWVERSAEGGPHEPEPWRDWSLDDEDEGIDDDDERVRLSPDQWFELDPDAAGGDPWGDELPDNDPWDVGEPTHVDV
ncbi:MAG: hypothetical protein AAF211_09030 [Myxococcota bacterium]